MPCGPDHSPCRPYANTSIDIYRIKQKLLQGLVLVLYIQIKTRQTFYFKINGIIFHNAALFFIKFGMRAVNIKQEIN